MKSFKERLEGLKADLKFIEWVGNRTEQEAWEECKRADWLMWYSFMAGIGSHRDRNLALCRCARFGLELFEKKYPGYDYPRKTIEWAEKFAGHTRQQSQESANFASAAIVCISHFAIEFAEDSDLGFPHMCAASYNLIGAIDDSSYGYGYAGLHTLYTLNIRENHADHPAWIEAHREMCNIIREKIKLKGGDHSDPA